MNEDKLLFLMLVQTGAIVRTLRDNRGMSVAVQVVASAASVPFEQVPKGDDEYAPYADAATELVDYQLQKPNGKIPAPEWTGW